VLDDKPERAVTFVDNHDFRGGDSAPVVNDKLMAYAFILTERGYPCVFWPDFFEAGLGRPGDARGIAALVRAHERYAGGEAVVRHVDDDLYVMERLGFGDQPGLVFVLNNRGDRWNGTFVDTTRPNKLHEPVAWSGRDDAAPEPSTTDGNGRGQFWAPPRGYAVYAVT
jgi:alpha-amylase